MPQFNVCGVAPTRTKTAKPKPMKIHEYQGKELFRKAGVPVLDGIIARSADDAVAAYEKLGGKIAVVKAQIHAGGRGKGTTKENSDQRGVVVCKSGDEVRAAALGLLGNRLVTIQTGRRKRSIRSLSKRVARSLANYISVSSSIGQ